MKKTIVLLAACALVLWAIPAGAQQRLQVTPFYGYVMPQGELPAIFTLTTRAGGTVDITDGELETRTPMYGATVGVKLLKRLSLEGTLLTGTDRLQASRINETDVKILAYSAGLAVELPRYWRLEPFLIGGVGVKSYDFDLADTKAVRDLEYNVGAGVNVELVKAFALNLQARNLMSEFSSSHFGVANERQNDILVAAGLTFTFGKAHHAAAIRH